MNIFQTLQYAGYILAAAGAVILLILILLIVALAQLSKIKKAVKPKAVGSAGAASAPQPNIQAGISGEIVAAIAAAVASLEDEGVSYSISSIKKAKKTTARQLRGRPIWGTIGAMESTNPF
ncbi:MAG: OadG family protein [Oscillospiraceae bacterium]|jgi:Na+-transporting methylmalonyl-CoA/oxaloacetate decarboxylase gamma subunit|nr:OadG family protein [Oscillospiraceae bacterium]